MQLVCLAFNNDMDTMQFLETGAITDSCVGKPIVQAPEYEAQLAEEIERIRRENPNLPRPQATQ